ncbi:MAG: PepSY-associated TM helix domain-containing protein [Pseudomonadales bacterium]
MMRKIHRWVSFPLIVFLLAVTVTGIYLQGEEIIAKAKPAREVPTVSSLPTDQELKRYLQEALVAARQKNPDFPAEKIEFAFIGNKAIAKFSTRLRFGPGLEVDLQTGDVTEQARPKRSLHTLFILLHTGKYYGMTGLIVIMLAGLVLLVLSVTGFFVYLDMYRRRSHSGKKNLFW